MEVSNDGSPPQPESPKPAFPEHPKPTSFELELISTITSSPPTELPRPNSLEPELASSSTSSPPPEPHRSSSPELPRPAPPRSELASSSTRTASPPPELVSSGTEIEEEEDGTVVSSENNQEISSPAPTDESDQNDWVIFIQQGLDRYSNLDREVWSRYSIFLAPSNLRKMEPEAYTPQFISIGPVHRGHPHLRLMEAHKWRFLRRSLDRTRHNLDVYIKAISPHMAEARGCYALLTDHMTDREFLEMMLLDSCFILELLIAVAQGISRRDDDPLFAVRAVVLCIRRDLLLLENQIPLFILEKLFPFTAGSSFKDYSVSQLALFFFSWTVPGSIAKQKAHNTGREKGLHFLHVIRQSLIPLQSMLPPPPPPPPPPPSQKPLAKFIDTYEHKHLTMRCVSMLVDSGVTFKKRMSSRLTNIEFDFKRGILKIPPLVVEDSTKSLFLNLMAFEQCYPKCSDHMSSYVVFMDGLINTPGDVAYLQQKGIINHQLGSEKAVAQLFNDLCREINIDYMYGSYIFALCSNVNKYVSRDCPSWKASLRREYFRHPWSIISVGAAVLIIVLTLAQAVYAILAYHVHRA